MTAPRVRRLRVNLGLHETSDCKPLLNIQASADGGLIVYPGRYIVSDRWLYGLLTLPGGSQAETVVELSQAPKLHYHRSGMVSIDATGTAPRRLIRCTPIESMRGAQSFCYVVHRPELVASGPFLGRPGDAICFAHGEWPDTFIVYGFLYGRDQVPNLDRAFTFADRASRLIPLGPGEIGIDLGGHGLDTFLLLRFMLRDGAPEHSADHATAALYGMDQRVLDGPYPIELVGMWTVDHGFLGVPVAPVPDLSRLHLSKPGELARVTRTRGAGVVDEEPLDVPPGLATASDTRPPETN
jgi:hypothetical protein